MSNSALVPNAKDALSRFKMEAATDVGVNLKQGYNGDLTSRQAGSIGGQMVKKMIHVCKWNICRTGRNKVNHEYILRADVSVAWI